MEENPLNPSHQAAEPREDTGHHRQQGVLAALVTGHAVTQCGKYRDKRQDGHGVGQRQEQRGRVGFEHIGPLARHGPRAALRSYCLIANVGEEQPSKDTQPGFEADERRNDGRDTQGTDESIDRIGCGRAQSRRETGSPPKHQTSLYAQQPNGSYRGCNAQPNDHRFNENQHKCISRMGTGRLGEVHFFRNELLIFLSVFP